MQVSTLQDMYVAELQELHSVERQLTEELPYLAARTGHKELAKALDCYRQHSQSQLPRLEELLSRFQADPDAHVDTAMKSLIAETDRWADQIHDPVLVDAALIGSIQRILHYEIAAFGTATAYAGALGLEADKRLLHDLLEDKKATDKQLSVLAKQRINPDAAQAA